MRAEVNGFRYAFWFRHRTEPRGKRKDRIYHVTECWVQPADKSLPPQVALAECSPLDRYDREKGRRMALTRVLALVFPGSGGSVARGAIWTARFALPSTEMTASTKRAAAGGAAFVRGRGQASRPQCRLCTPEHDIHSDQQGEGVPADLRNECRLSLGLTACSP